jgi:two-component system alkaline phosphatase synthesis response regulator PhoP
MEDIRILIVNINKDERDFLFTTLKNEGYLVFTTTDGKTAVTKAKEISPHLIILDVVMPGMDGIETCKELKALPECAGCSIMFLSSREEDYTQIAALDAGADEYILKPIRPRVLISRVKALLRRTAMPAKNVTAFGRDMTIDSHSHTVKVGKTEVTLSKKEFDLLKLLTSKPGKVYSRQAIHEIVWNGDLEINDRIIDVHVWKLRQKLGKERIKTLKGIGYKMGV